MGCRPSLEELSSIWELALRGIDGPDKKTLLVHFVEDRERIRQETLDALVQEANEPATLDNLTLNAQQNDPLREIEIQIGPGRETSVTVEAEDHTWAIGRHAEIMERLTKTRKWYAMGDGSIPEWPKKKQEKTDSLLAQSLKLIFNLAVGAPAAFMVYIALLFLVAAPVFMVDGMIHHKHITGLAVALFAIDLAIIVAAIFLALLVVKDSKSMVVIRPEPLITTSRIAIVTTATAIIGAVSAIIGVVKK